MFPAMQESPPYGTVTRGIRSVAKDDVNALKCQDYNQNQGGVGRKTSVSEGRGYLKPFSPIAGSLGPVLAKVQGEG